MFIEEKDICLYIEKDISIYINIYQQKIII